MQRKRDDRLNEVEEKEEPCNNEALHNLNDDIISLLTEEVIDRGSCHFSSLISWMTFDKRICTRFSNDHAYRVGFILRFIKKYKEEVDQRIMEMNKDKAFLTKFVNLSCSLNNRYNLKDVDYAIDYDQLTEDHDIHCAIIQRQFEEYGLSFSMNRDSHRSMYDIVMQFVEKSKEYVSSITDRWLTKVIRLSHMDKRDPPILNDHMDYIEKLLFRPRVWDPSYNTYEDFWCIVGGYALEVYDPRYKSSDIDIFHSSIRLPSMLPPSTRDVSLISAGNLRIITLDQSTGKMFRKGSPLLMLSPNESKGKPIQFINIDKSEYPMTNEEMARSIFDSIDMANSCFMIHHDRGSMANEVDIFTTPLALYSIKSNLIILIKKNGLPYIVRECRLKQYIRKGFTYDREKSHILCGDELQTLHIDKLGTPGLPLPAERDIILIPFNDDMRKMLDNDLFSHKISTIHPEYVIRWSKLARKCEEELIMSRVR